MQQILLFCPSNLSFVSRTFKPKTFTFTFESKWRNPETCSKFERTLRGVGAKFATSSAFHQPNTLILHHPSYMIYQRGKDKNAKRQAYKRQHKIQKGQNDITSLRVHFTILTHLFCTNHHIKKEKRKNKTKR